MKAHCTIHVGSRRAGFTLVEVLLAVTILAVVMTAVYSTWSTALAAWKRATSVSGTFQRQRIVMDTLSELTRSAVFSLPNPPLCAVKGTHDAQAGDSVSFVTASEDLLPPSEMILAGLRRVTISLRRDEWGRSWLGIANAPALKLEDETANPPSHLIGLDVTGFSVRYFDPRDATWHEAWEDSMALPRAVEYTVTFDTGAPGVAPVVLTRMVEFPAAGFAGQHLGESPPARLTEPEEPPNPATPGDGRRGRDINIQLPPNVGNPGLEAE